MFVCAKKCSLAGETISGSNGILKLHCMGVWKTKQIRPKATYICLLQPGLPSLDLHQTYLEGGTMAHLNVGEDHQISVFRQAKVITLLISY